MSLSAAKFSETLVSSGLLTEEQVHALWDSLPIEERPSDGPAWAALLARRGLLSDFQTRELLSGRNTALVLDQYVIIDQIGAGGMGQVFKAQHRQLKRVVALKLLPLGRMHDSRTTQRFQRELEVAGKLVHPHIVTTHDAGEWNGLHYLVMEYIDGQDLARLIKRDGPLSTSLAVGYVIQIARGLEHAHSEGVVHRDIKPSNMLVDKHGTVKILDMGIARVERDDADESRECLTATGNVMGTVDFMSPEQAVDSKQADARSDIYSLGCTLYFLLTGRPLYDADTQVKKLLAHREMPVPSLRATRPDVTVELERVYYKMVSKQPEARYQTMREARLALEAACAGAGASVDDTIRYANASPSSESGLEKQLLSGSRRVYGFIVAGLAALFVMAALAWSLVPTFPWPTQTPKNDSTPDSLIPLASVLPTRPSIPSTPDRKVSEWVLSAGGKVGIVFPPATTEQIVSTPSDLPSQEFALTKIDLFQQKNWLDDDLHVISALGQLRDLRLEATALTDIGMAHVEGLHSLTSLNVSTSQVGDAGLLYVQKLTNLTNLQLGNLPQVTDSGLKHLQSLTALTYLSLANTRITDDGLATLTPLSNLQTLHLNKTTIGDAGLSTLQSFAELSDLDLSFTKITDTGLLKLYELKKLTKLNLRGLDLSDAATVKLKQALPNTSILQ